MFSLSFGFICLVAGGKLPRAVYLAPTLVFVDELEDGHANRTTNVCTTFYGG